MAEIKMDISEYELLKENKKLLENSLEKERTLQLEIKQLIKDKLKVLEDAKMKVIKTIKTENTEILYTRKSEYDVLINLMHFVDSYKRGNYPTRTNDSLGYSIQHLIDSIFIKSNTTGIVHEQHEVIGLDEVKKELKVKLEKDLSADIRIKLQQAEEAKAISKIYQDENIDLREKNKNISEYFDNLQTNFLSVSKELDEIKNNSLKIRNISLVLKHVTVFNKKRSINRISEIINNK